MVKNGLTKFGKRQKRDEKNINLDDQAVSKIYLTDERDEMSLFSYMLPIWIGSD